jgi:hypothetical protein
MDILIAEIKSKIGYTTAPLPKCKNCKFSSESDGVMDRTWITSCRIADNVMVFTVDQDARCDKHQLRQTAK